MPELSVLLVLRSYDSRESGRREDDNISYENLPRHPDIRVELTFFTCNYGCCVSSCTPLNIPCIPGNGIDGINNNKFRYAGLFVHNLNGYPRTRLDRG